MKAAEEGRTVLTTPPPTPPNWPVGQGSRREGAEVSDGLRVQRRSSDRQSEAETGRGRHRYGLRWMHRDTFNNHGQAGAVGPGAHAHDNTFQQIQGGIDLPKLAEELRRLRDAMKGEATATREQDKAIGAVADAEEAAAKGDGQSALRYLKSAGTWTLGIAQQIGVALATEALKKAM